jgi:uncharacterized protein YcfL
MKPVKLTVLALLLCFGSVGFAQSSNEGFNQTIFDSELASISTEYVECIDEANGTAKAYLLINAVNKSNSVIDISFKKNLWFDGECVNCESESNEHILSFELEPSETKTGGCETNSGMRIFVRMLNLTDVRQLTHFELETIEVTKL